VKTLLLILVMLLSLPAAQAQQDGAPAPQTIAPRDLRSDIERNWDIRLVSGERLSSVGLAGLRDDSLIVRGSGGEIAVAAVSLASMRRENRGHFWRGAAFGGGLMALPALAVLLAPQHHDSPGFQYFVAPAGVVVGALVGGVIGSFFEDTDEFDFMLLTDDQKALGAERMVEFDRR
jgi:hypothetical protein